MKHDVALINQSFDLLALAEQDTTLHKMGAYYIGPCSFCGGQDRMNLKSTSSGFLWICRNCAPEKYHSAIDYVMRRERISFLDAVQRMSANGLHELDPSIIAERKRRSEIEQACRQAEIDARLSDLSTREIWDALHRRLTEDSRAWWRKAGVPNDWQDYLFLGYTERKPYYNKCQQLCYSPAYTIPYFHYDANSTASKRFVTMQYRLADTSDPSERYRFEHGVGSSFYMVEPTVPIGENVIVCEGAKKGIVARVYGKLKGFTVLSVPSKSDSGGLLKAIKHCQRVWLILDPDATNRTYNLAKEIGKAARVVELPAKLDDAILSGALTPNTLARYMFQAVKI